MFVSLTAYSQEVSVSGFILANGQVVEKARISLKNEKVQTLSDSLGFYFIQSVNPGTHVVQIQCVGYLRFEQDIIVSLNENNLFHFDLTDKLILQKEVVVSGTLKEVNRLESSVPVEVYSTLFFRKNPSSSVFETLQNINGVKPQLNCNVCNTGDIQVNGLDGPYTMILIDGMPLVSSLSAVYSLSGIPNSIIERVEVVKGPASSLYGSEAIGGLINIITKKPQKSAIASVDVFATSWHEYNTDIGLNSVLGKKVSILTGINYFNFQERIDNNKDNFTDVALQHRISVFQKWNINRINNRIFSVAGRILNEDRFGGEMNWDKQFRAGDSIYGESIYTKRWEVFGSYQLPLKEQIIFSFSFNNHNQNSAYGSNLFLAKQSTAFTQLTWNKKINRNDFLVGSAFRYTHYDDNTLFTALVDTFTQINLPQRFYLPGFFIQDELVISKKHTFLFGVRYDYNSFHGNIYTPRIAYKWTINSKNMIRLNSGTGFRVVNLFSEDHAALTGARTVEVIDELSPEKSYNININYLKRINLKNCSVISLESTSFYTYFSNRIVGDFDSDPNKIIYANLDGFAVSKGVSLNVDGLFSNGIRMNIGCTFMENTLTENGETEQQILVEKFTGTWAFSYKIEKFRLVLDYTGNVYSPMRLPVLSELDPRRKFSPWWSIQNIQFTYSAKKSVQVYAGIKNLLNWTPNKGNPFIIARSEDPFDKEVLLGNDGNAIPTATNPYGLTFDPTYIYAPNQGIRFFLGIRYTF